MRILSFAVLAAVAVVGISADEETPNTGMADPAALVNAFDRSAAGGQASNVLVLSVSNLRGVSTEAMNAGGTVKIDLTNGAVTSTVELLPAGATFDLWLLDNRSGPGHTTLAEPQDALMRVGTYAAASGAHALSVTLGPGVFNSFFPDRAFVVRSGESPLHSFVLTGPSTLFDRLRRRQVRFVDDASAPRGFDAASPSRYSHELIAPVAASRRTPRRLNAQQS